MAEFVNQCASLLQTGADEKLVGETRECRHSLGSQRHDQVAARRTGIVHSVGWVRDATVAVQQGIFAGDVRKRGPGAIIHHAETARRISKQLGRYASNLSRTRARGDEDRRTGRPEIEVEIRIVRIDEAQRANATCDLANDSRRIVWVPLMKTGKNRVLESKFSRSAIELPDAIRLGVVE